MNVGRIRVLPAPASAIVGGKAENLSRLLSLGLPVPDAFVVTASAFCDQLARPALARLVEASFADLEGRASRLMELRAAVEVEPLDDDLGRELAAAFAALSCDAVAVRSSAVGEDSASHSFAGQHDTVLGVGDDRSLLDAVRRCWASAFSDRAVEYRAHCRLDPRAVQMAVVVQRLVDAESSGVLFTCDPVSGRDDRIVVEAVPGLGEALVSGRATPARWIIDRGTRQIVERIGDRTDANTEPVLVDPIVIELARIGLDLESTFGGPQDIEFAVEQGRIQILQARPVTTRRPPDPGDRIVWSNTNIGELAPDVATPMTFSVIRQFVDHLMSPLVEKLGLDISKLDFLGLVAGRVYINMNATVALLRTIPGLRRKSYADFFGGDTTALGPALASLTEADLPEARSRRFRTLLRIPGLIFWFLRHARMKVTGLMRSITAETALLARSDPRSADDEELLRRVDHSMPHTNKAIGFVCVSSAQWFAALSRRWLGDVDGSIANRLLAGLGGVDSAEAGLDLWRLAVDARACGVAGEILSSRTFVDLRDRLEGTTSGGAFLSRWDAFMERHGHHTRAEIDVAIPRWREQPDYVLGLVRGYLSDANPRDPLILHQKTTLQREVLAGECRRRLGPLHRCVFDWIYARARKGLALREGAKSDFIRRIAIMRRDLLEAGRRLVERGALGEAEEVFFLSREELGDALLRMPPPRLQATVAERRAEHARFVALNLPPVVVGRFDPSRVLPPRVDTATILRGIAVSAGLAVGKARVILRADTEERVLPGEILVAPFTDPGWTPYFLPAAAIVMDQGGMLSHGSIVARELGVPAVVNVGPATRFLRTGQLVRVDAYRGEVSILDDAVDVAKNAATGAPTPKRLTEGV